MPFVYDNGHPIIYADRAVWGRIDELVAAANAAESITRLLKPILSEMGPEVPRHSCDYVDDPEKGDCWFCRMFVELWELVDPDDEAAIAAEAAVSEQEGQ